MPERARRRSPRRAGFSGLVGATVSFALCLAACDGGVGVVVPEQPYNSIRIGGLTSILWGDHSVQLTAQDSAGQPVDAPLEWSSTDEGVASVTQDGLVTARSAGSTTIRVGLPGGPWASRAVHVRRWVDVATNGAQTCAVTSDGDLYCWWEPKELYQRNSWWQLAALLRFRDVGMEYWAIACGVTTAGWVYCDSDWHQYAYRGQSDTRLPGHVIQNVRVTSITAHGLDGGGGCGLAVDGSAYCWNAGDPSGLLLPGGERFRHLSTGSSGVGCGVAMDGRGLCWDYGTAGLPVEIPGGYRYRTLVRDAERVCGVTEDGDGLCWGVNRWGKLGIGVDGGDFFDVQRVAGGITFASIQVPFKWWPWLGAGHTCGLTPEGKAYCWGLNNYHQSGSGSDSPVLVVPTAVAGDLTFTHLALGDLHTCGVTPGGLLYCWGGGISGAAPGGRYGPGPATPKEVFGPDL